MSNLAAENKSGELITTTKEVYGDRFQEHLLEQYKLYVDSSHKVSEKRISTGNYLLTVSSSLLTVFGVASTMHVGSAWLIIIPIAGMLVSLTWFSLVISYKDLNTAKFKVIHELEQHLPAALFRYEWHTCEQGRGRAYKPITHLERWIPIIFAAVHLVLAIYVIVPRPVNKAEDKPISINGTVDVNLKSPDPLQSAADKQAPKQKQSRMKQGGGSIR